GAARIVDRSRAEDRVQLLQRLVVARVEEAVMAGRTGDMAAVEGAHIQAGERPLHHAAQSFLSDVLEQHPEAVLDHLAYFVAPNSRDSRRASRGPQEGAEEAPHGGDAGNRPAEDGGPRIHLPPYQ